MTRLRGVGLALSGGAVRGLAHIAVLEVLEEEGIPVTAVAGTSAGSIVGGLYAAGVPLERIRHLAVTAGWKKIFRLSFPKKGLLESDGIAAFMKANLPVRRFEGLTLPFAAVATDLRTGEKVSLTTGSIARAVQASCSLPVVFAPTVIRGRPLVDGGVVSNLPVETARKELGAGKVVAVDVNARERGPERYDNILKIALQVSTIWATQNTREEAELADLVVSVDASGIAPYDTRKTVELLSRGRRAARARIKAIQELLRTGVPSRKRRLRGREAVDRGSGEA